MSASIVLDPVVRNASVAVIQRVRRLILRYCEQEPAVLTCEFEPMGKVKGVGVISPLWCARCGREQMWHDVARAAAIAAASLEVVPPVPEIPEGGVL